MENDVLTKKDLEDLFQLKHNQFAGTIGADQRARFEKAFELKYKKPLVTMWTCSSCLRTLAKQLL